MVRINLGHADASRRYAALVTGKAGVVYALEAPPITPSYSEIGLPNLIVHRFDLGKRKSDVLIAGVKSFQPSFNGEEMLYQQGDRWKASISEIVYLTSTKGRRAIATCLENS